MVMGDRIKPAVQQAMRQAKQDAGTVPGKHDAGERVDQGATPPRQTDGQADAAAKDELND